MDFGVVFSDAANEMRQEFSGEIRGEKFRFFESQIEAKLFPTVIYKQSKQAQFYYLQENREYAEFVETGGEIYQGKN